MAEFFAAGLGPSTNPLSWSSLLTENFRVKPDVWSVPEAFVAVLLAAVISDGEISAAEHEEILALVHRSRALKTLTPEQLGDVNVRVLERLRTSDDALAAACRALPEEMRAPAFAHALDLVLADGELNEDEADFLNALILALGLDGKQVEHIADVIVLKNRY